MKPFVLWTCPKCEMPVRARGATEVVHECWANSYRLTAFKPAPALDRQKAEAQSKKASAL